MQHIHRRAEYQQALMNAGVSFAQSCMDGIESLRLDPANMQKRLGDGFYEQKLIREQIAQLTGMRFLDGYASDEEQYRALIDNGVTFAKDWKLTPGVALTAAQMAQLTSDIVWLVEQTLKLPDGTVSTALVPQVYARVQPGDIDGSGALISGRNVNLALSGELMNQGTIAGRGVLSLSAQNVNNLGGRISGGDVGVQARNDLNNIGGMIEASNSLYAGAGRDLNIVSTATSNSNAQGSVTNLSRVAGLYVTSSSGGTLLASAGRDLNLRAAQIVNAGAQGTTGVVAGQDINLGTVTVSNANSLTWDAKNWRKEAASQEVGSTVQAVGNISLSAGNNLNARAATVTSTQGALTATAVNNVTLTAGQSTLQVDEAHQHTGRTGGGNKVTTTTRDTLDQSTAQASTFSGKTVAIGAGNDVNVIASNVVSDAGTVIAAKNDINIVAGTNTSAETHFKDEKKSGIFSSGGVGFTIGTQQQSVSQQGASTTAAASTIGAIQGDVVIQAGRTYTQTGSDVIVPKGDVNITAQNVAIQEAREATRAATETKFKQSGLTLAVTAPVISAQQTASQMQSAAGKTDDSRMKALAGAAIALSAKNAYDQTAQAINDPKNTNAVSISITVGGSKSESKTTQTSDTGRGSTVAGGNNVNITATGAGEASNITIRGSEVTAGNKASLKAEGNVNLLGAANTSELTRDSSSQSAGVGVAVTVGQGGVGFGFTANASAGKGNAEGKDTASTMTRVTAGNKASIESGGDTNVIDAVVAADQITGKIGGSLNIESKQDTSAYNSKDQNIGGSVTTGAGFAGSVSYSNSKVNADFASVGEQSGLKAGSGGYQLDVQDNTKLTAGVIASNQAAIDSNKNSLKTGTLTTSDIENKANANASSSGFGLSSDMFDQGKYGAAKAVVSNSLNNGSASESASGVTRSAVSGGRIEITNEAKQLALTGQTAEETIANLNRDTASANQTVGRPDVDALAAQAQATQAIKTALYNETVKFTDEAYRTMFLKEAKIYVIEKDGEGNPVKRELTNEEKFQLKPGADGKIHIANNGIFNDLDAAAKYAIQHSTVDGGPQYLIHFDQANNVISELMIAGYQKFMEGNLLGLTNATQENINLMNQYGQIGLHLDGHSRGAMTIGNAMKSLGAQGYSQGSLSGTTINFFGPAYNALQADNLLGYWQNRPTGEAGQGMVLQYQNHVADPVGTLIGGNPATGGTIPTNTLWEMIRAATGQPNTSHNSYGIGSKEAEKFWNDGLPVLVPVIPLESRK